LIGMTPVRSVRPRVRCLGAIALLVLATSCSVWRPQPGVGLARPEVEWVGHARALLRDGTVLDLDDVTISPDTIVGLGGATRTRFALPRTDVASVRVQRTDGTLTFLAGVLTTLFLYAAGMVRG
jgi:hypothetical protein